jgi:hypothetical protein
MCTPTLARHLPTLLRAPALTTLCPMPPPLAVHRLWHPAPRPLLFTAHPPARLPSMAPHPAQLPATQCTVLLPAQLPSMALLPAQLLSMVLQRDTMPTLPLSLPSLDRTTPLTPAVPLSLLSLLPTSTLVRLVSPPRLRLSLRLSATSARVTQSPLSMFATTAVLLLLPTL